MLKVVEILRRGGIIAYPTEAVYGLGCDPFNEKAVHKLLKLKQREQAKGVILVAASWQQVQTLAQPIAHKLLEKALATWPGPITWVFPASAKTPIWIRGAHNSIAIRISAHPLIQTICKTFAGPIVSTSANLAGHKPARTKEEVLQQFPQGIDFIVEGKLGELAKSTPIYDILTGEIIRN